MESADDLAVLFEGKASYLRELAEVLAASGIAASVVQPPGSKLNS